MKDMIRCSFKNHNSKKVRQNPCNGTHYCVLFLNTAMFRGISGQTHRVNIFLKEQFDMCFVAKMYILGKSASSRGGKDSGHE